MVLAHVIDREASAWHHTSHMLAYIANASPNRQKGKGLDPRECYPKGIQKAARQMFEDRADTPTEEPAIEVPFETMWKVFRAVVKHPRKDAEDARQG